MTREQLEQAIRAATELARVDEVVVFGSQAILGSFPDAHPKLLQSVEVDMCPLHEPDRVDEIEAVAGELSQFAQTHGFYIHAIPITEAATLPAGWRDRLIPVGNANTERRTGWCLEPHDLAASKLAGFREKDRDYVRTLLVEGFIRPETLDARIRALPLDDAKINRMLAWLQATSKHD